MSITRHQVGPRMSQAVVHGDTVYLAGQVADDPSAGVKGQTEQVLRKIDTLLKTTGSDKTKLLSATIWITDMRSFADMNAAWDAWVAPGHTPARATVQAALASPQYLVEIGIVAARD
ncbi:MAG: RidA family protein [Proteobacteria bacterium]|nr:RidA family protein [Pseudomonadota bacterium]